MNEIDLSRYRSPVTLGTRGAIVLDGEGVAEHHVDLRVERGPNGERCSILRPLAPGVTVERAGKSVPLTTGWQVLDGDVIRIGHVRVTYRNLCTEPERTKEGSEVPWLYR